MRAVVSRGSLAGQSRVAELAVAQISFSEFCQKRLGKWPATNLVYFSFEKKGVLSVLIDRGQEA